MNQILRPKRVADGGDELVTIVGIWAIKSHKCGFYVAFRTELIKGKDKIMV